SRGVGQGAGVAERGAAGVGAPGGREAAGGAVVDVVAAVVGRKADVAIRVRHAGDDRVRERRVAVQEDVGAVVARAVAADRAVDDGPVVAVVVETAAVAGWRAVAGDGAVRDVRVPMLQMPPPLPPPAAVLPRIVQRLTGRVPLPLL